MRIIKALSALALLGSVSACYPPTQSAYGPAVWETPQRVGFFYGQLVSVRPANIAYGGPAGFGLRARWSPWLAGLSAQAGGPSGGFGATVAGVGVFFEVSIPNVPAVEYTVMLDNGTNPPDPYIPRQQKTPIIVVQNVYPDEQPGPAPPNRVVVRVVGNSARVIAAPPPPFPQGLLAAAAPMPIPLQGPPAALPPPAQPAESYGYRQALYQNWVIER